jgi:hypothetical protein
MRPIGSQETVHERLEDCEIAREKRRKDREINPR